MVATAGVSSIPQLPWNDINVLIVTDVHSWIGGHERHALALLQRGSHDNNNNSQTNVTSSSSSLLLNVDYGHVLSFYQHLQQYAAATAAAQQHHNLFFVMNGDFIHGTGLTEFPPRHLTSLLQEYMPWDAINIGNHELYRNSTVEHLHDILHHSNDEEEVQHEPIFSWKSRYVTSNIVYSSTGHPLANRFIYLRGPSATVLTFGFLYNFQGCSAAMVESVQDVVQSDWFINVLSSSSTSTSFDAILVLAHMDVQDSLIVHVLLPAMRQLVGPDMPIQFVTGHTHIRGFAILDGMSTSLQAGRYLDTIGFCSFPSKQRNQQLQQQDYTNGTAIINATTNTSHLFQHVLLDANQETLRSVLQVAQLDTPDGKALSLRIHQMQEELGLLKSIGCSPMTYYLDYILDHPQSLWRLYLSQVIPIALFANNKNSSNSHEATAATSTASSSRMVFVQATDGLRFDLFQGQVLVDDVIAVSPFQDVIYRVISQIRGDVLLEILEDKAKSIPTDRIDAAITTMIGNASALPEYAFVMSGNGGQQEIVNDELYDIMTVELDLGYVMRRIEEVTGIVAIPQPVDVGAEHAVVLTSTQLWMDFVTTKWSCTVAVASSNNNKAMEMHDTWMLWLLGIALGAVLLLVVVRKSFAGCRRHGHGYKAAAVDGDQHHGDVSEVEL